MGVEDDVKVLREDLEIVITEAMKCKLDVYNKISNFEESLETASIDRANYNLMLNNKIDKLVDSHEALVKSQIKLQDWFTIHDEKEMETNREQTKAINNLTSTLKEVVKTTREHDSYIQSEEYNRKMEEMVQKRLDAENAPKKEMIYKAKMAAITTITVAILYGAYYAIKFVYDLSVKLGG